MYTYEQRMTAVKRYWHNNTSVPRTILWDGLARQ